MADDVVSESPSAPSPFAFRLRWDVFLSFRGEDTRYGITNDLYNSLQAHGVRVFRDDDGLNRGDEIAPALLEAIEDSAASIVILSPNYASSHWCLEELARICELRRLILPVFYLVDPSHVRHQRGPFEAAFTSHKQRFGELRLEKWKRALQRVGNVAGWVFHSSSNHQELIGSLVKRVLTELSNTPMHVTTYTVGLDSRLEKLVTLLNIKSNGILVLGLHGMGGVGKTTLAKALYNKLFGLFEYRSFISNIREISGERQDGLISLQKKFLGDLASEVKSPVNEVKSGINAIRATVQEKKVLVVLDDVDDSIQLNALAGKRGWFGEGSRIIITTRDREVLQETYVDQFYEVKELDSSEALELFSHLALGRKKPTEIFLDLSKEIVSLTGGLPLAVEVFGSFLFDKRRKEEWEDEVQKLRLIRPRNLHDVLKISFDGLDEQEKCIFLDIACLLVKIRMKREDAIHMLKGCGFRAEITITVLVAKSLVKIKEDHTLWMHDQLRDMGRQIVQQENLLDPGMRSRLWDRDEIMTVLQNCKGTRCIQGIIFDFEKKNLVRDRSAISIAWDRLRKEPSVTSVVRYLTQRYKKCFQHRREKEEVTLHTNPFGPMVNLRLLEVSHVKLEGKFTFLTAELRWLQWKGCPLKKLPSDFRPQKLAVLDLSESKIIRVWGHQSNKVAGNLMVLNLYGCYNLANIPDLSGCRTLERLVVERCSSLVKLHKSIGSVTSLLYLNLRECSNLTEFPSDVSGLKHLESLILSRCSKLKELPADIGGMKSLKELLVDETAIDKLPETIFRLEKLEKLSLNSCKYIKQLPMCLGQLVSLKEFHANHSAIEELPDSVGSLTNLEKLSLMGCKSLTAIPDTIGNLKSLHNFFIDRSAINELPASVGSLSYLKDLSASGCKSLSKLPDSIRGLASLVALTLNGAAMTHLPDQIGDLKLLQKLDMSSQALISLPESLGSMSALVSLNLSNANIMELPESIGMLENLVTLRLHNCVKLQKLPASIGRMKSLQRLQIAETSVTELPESFGMLSSLVVLEMAKKPFFRLRDERGITSSANFVSQENLNNSVLPKSFSSLSLLQKLDARTCRISGMIPDDFENLSSLEILNLGNNNFSSLPSSLRGLSFLKRLLLSHCQELKSLPPLPSSLLEVKVESCISLEVIYDLSNLESLEDLNLTNCEKVVDVPGLECLKSLKRLYMSGCTCSPSIKRRLSKGCLRKLRNLSMPGSQLPTWLSKGAVTFTSCKNREIKGAIIGVVISVDHQIPCDLRYQLPDVTDIQAKILKLGEPVFTTVLRLGGVPMTNDDQVYLCRYPQLNPLVWQLQEGYKIEVAKCSPPLDKGIELKACGIHLIFENDDDYGGDEEMLDESQQSISQKLVEYFNSC